MITIGLIQFPGSNCERETALAVKRAGMEPVDFLWNEPIEKLESMQGYILVGGFSYEDRSRAGIIAALDPIMNEIKAQAEKGKPVLGICNGAQILLEAGMLNSSDNQFDMALTENKRITKGKILGTGFYNVWVTMRLSQDQKPNAFNRHLTTKDVIYLPVAHAEGRFLMPEARLKTLEQEGLNLFQYCDEQGEIIEHFPINPNGSMGNIAAIVNCAGNVMAMMPHPERTSHGDPIFSSMRDYILEAKSVEIPHRPSTTVSQKPSLFKKRVGSHECLIKLIITDNQALTLQKTLQKLGYPITANRYIHWEIDCDDWQMINEIKKTDVLYCERKERELAVSELNRSTSLFYLVRSKENLLGQQASQTLHDHYSIKGIKQINHGILWEFSSNEININDQIDAILQTNIIRGYAHECYRYND